MKRLLILALVLMVTLSCRREQSAPTGTAGEGVQSGAAAAANTGSEVGSVLPAYTATLLDGSKFDLHERRRNVVLLNLWATWCAPCRYEIPELQAMHEEYGSRGFEVIGVSVDEGAPEAVREFVDEYRMTYPVVLDPEGQLANLLETSVLPTTVLLDREGKIVWKKFGAIEANDPELVKAIEATL